MIQHKGFTFLEICLALSIASAMVVWSLGPINKFHQLIVDHSQNISQHVHFQLFLMRLHLEVTQAGYGLKEDQWGLQVESGVLKIRADFDQNGVFTEKEEVTYLFDPATHQIKRKAGAGGYQAVAPIFFFAMSGIHSNGINHACVQWTTRITSDEAETKGLICRAFFAF